MSKDWVKIMSVMWFMYVDIKKHFLCNDLSLVEHTCFLHLVCKLQHAGWHAVFIVLYMHELKLRSPCFTFWGDRFFTDLVFSCSQRVSFVFVIDVDFRSEKYWASFDAGERESVDDAGMRIVTHDRSPLWGLWLWSQYFIRRLWLWSYSFY